MYLIQSTTEQNKNKLTIAYFRKNRGLYFGKEGKQHEPKMPREWLMHYSGITIIDGSDLNKPELFKFLKSTHSGKLVFLKSILSFFSKFEKGRCIFA